MPDAEPRVLLFAGAFQARGRSVYTLRLAEHLPARGVQVHVVCTDASVLEPEQRTALSIHEYPRLEWPVLGRFHLQHVAQDLAETVPDLIHIQARKVLRPGARLARRLNRPYVLTVHDYLHRGERLRIDWRLCRRVICVSESVRRSFCTRAEVPEGRIVVIPSGVELDADPDAPPPLQTGHVPVVGAAGALESLKGFPFFLGAAQKVLATGRDVEFIVAGVGPEEANLRRLARELGIAEKVTFVPYLHYFSDSLASMDVFCLPALEQGLGTIMLEAMALGKPVIATRVGGVYSVVHDNETGLLVPPGDSRRLADRILELLNDPLRARALGQSARQLVRRDFGIDRMLDQTAHLYREVLAETTPPPPPPTPLATAR